MTQGSTENSLKRQAVVVIHGIGEQDPISTLRDFVSSLLAASPNGDPPAYYSLSTGQKIQRLAK
ncbi:hypothetical protein RintRC_3495 [Richelia intracellularis]|nr:hypothetical protein RintRC_3495 [Richelia intracellularis]